MLLPFVAFLFLVIATILFILVRRQKQNLGLPRGRLIYADTSRWGKLEKPLYDPKLRLTGKPDYLVDQHQQIIPVEVKSSKGVNLPYDSHIYQLAAYCLLVHCTYGARPEHGIIHYPEHTYEISFTKKLEDDIRKIISEMQNKTNQSQVNRSHEDFKRCKSCGYRSMCDQALRI